jgi:nucleotide sugar dehydrogenase
VDLVVIGLGYVGLPLAREACRAGLTVAGLDRDPRVVAGLKAGLSHVDDVNPAEIEEMLAAGFTPSRDESILEGARTVVICVPTPLSPEGGPDLTAVQKATQTVSRHLNPGTLVVLESTTYPGTTEEIVGPILEESGLKAGEDFHLAFSPERIDPGNPVYGVANTPKIVGGLTPACASAAAGFYGKFVEQVVQAKGTREAEMAKLLENTYRHVNIALVNEMAVFCHELGIDLWDAIGCAATKPFGFQAFYPGPGVGGHCIPIDPNYLSYKVRSLGVTYKADIADQRESPARPVAARLRKMGADLTFHDPHVDDWEVDGVPVPRARVLYTALAEADLVVVLTDHHEYDADTLTRHARLLFDTRGRTRMADESLAERVELL